MGSSHSVSRSSIESSSNISSDMSESLRHNLANSAFPRQRWLALRDFFNNPDFTLLDPQLKDQGLPRQRWLALRDFFNDPDFTLLDPQMKDQGLKISTNDDEKKFEISVDTQDFKPEEVKVNVKNNVVTIAAKHEEQKNEGSNNKSYVSKQFAHSRTLPSSCKMENVTSNLTSPGLVLVSAPKTAKAVSFKVPIEVKK